MKENKPRKQHTVPQFYLKRFLLKSSNRESLYVYDKKQNKVFISSIDSISAHRDIYTINTSDNEYALEENYAQIIEPNLKLMLDTLTANLTNNVINYKNGISVPCMCTDAEKREFARGLLYQLMRTEKSISKIKNLGKNISCELQERAHKSFYSELSNANKKIIDSLSDVDNSFFGDAMVSVLSRDNHDEIVEKFLDFCWLFYRLPYTTPYFVTSDSPVVLTDETNVTLMDFGLIHPTAVFVYPLSPMLILVGYSSLGKNELLMKEFDRKLVDLNFSNLRDKDFVIEMNLCQLRNCNRQVISGSKGILDCFIR